MEIKGCCDPFKLQCLFGFFAFGMWGWVDSGLEAVMRVGPASQPREVWDTWPFPWKASARFLDKVVEWTFCEDARDREDIPNYRLGGPRHWTAMEGECAGQSPDRGRTSSQMFQLWRLKWKETIYQGVSRVKRTSKGGKGTQRLGMGCRHWWGGSRVEELPETWKKETPVGTVVQSSRATVRTTSAS